MVVRQPSVRGQAADRLMVVELRRRTTEFCKILKHLCDSGRPGILVIPEHPQPQKKFLRQYIYNSDK